MNRSLILCLILSFLFSPSGKINAQDSPTFSGEVADALTGEPLAGVIIALRSVQGKIIKYTTSDRSGCFTLKSGAKSESTDSLQLSLLGYATIKVPVSEEKMVLKMIPEAINIREVVIKAPKIEMKGDTIKYSVSNFAEAQDKNLGEVLKKMPGIDVEKGGQIKYNGTPINKMYIEGLDMLGGKYALATNNIPPKDVKSVEILENHQPTKALKDIAYSEQAALNIKLQDGAKAKWIGTADIGGGIGGAVLKDGAAGDAALWNTNLFAMRIGSGWQNINTFKSNNIGRSILSDINSFEYSDIFSGSKHYTLNDFLSSGISNAPLAEERVKLNRSHLFNTTNTVKLSEDYKIDIQASYFHEKTASANNSQTSYFLEDSTIITIDDKKAAASAHSVKTSAELLANTDRYYIKDHFAFSGEWTGSDISMEGYFPNDGETGTKTADFNNDFQFIKRIKKHSLSAGSYVQYSSQFQNLSIVRPEGEMQRQNIHQSAFFTNTYSSYGLNFSKNWSLSFKGGISTLNRSMESTLSGIDTDISTENDLRVKYIDTYLQPTLIFDAPRFTASLNLPVNYYHYSENDDLVIKPRLYLKYSVSSKFSLKAAGTYGNSPLNERDFYEGLILTDYRNLRRGAVNYKNDTSGSVSLSFEYKNPINMLFFNGTAIRSWNTLNNLSSRTFAGNYIINSTLDVSNDKNVWYALIGGSKGFYGINGLLGVEASFSSSSSTMIQSSTESEPSLTPFISTMISVKPHFKGRMSPWLLLEYQLSYYHNILEMKEGGSISHNNSFDHSLGLTFSPVKSLSVKLTAEHYFSQISSSQNINTILADIVARYTINSHFELSLSATNVLNQKSYSYTSFNGPSSFSASYLIRPCNILFGLYIK